MTKPFFKRKAGSRLAWSIAAAMTVGTGVGSVAYAQDGESLEEVEEIVVTGSRIRRQDYNSANPVSTFDAEELNNLGIVNAGDALQQIPSNVSAFTPANTGGSAFQVGANLADLRGLNPYFGTRTVTLVDTRRHVSTNQGGSVDLNFIPSVMIGRIETVTGGASASYGADAISGVVNILLDTSFEGVKLDVDYGINGEGDGDNAHVGFAWGTAFGDGRGHFIIGGEAQDQEVIQSCAAARDWCAASVGFFSNGSGGGAFGTPGVTFTPTIPGQPQNILLDNLRNQTSENGRTFTDVPGAATYRFNDAGTDLVPWDAGQYAYTGQTATVVGGEGKSIYDNLTLMPANDRKVIMAHATWDFTDTLTGFVEYSYGNVRGTNIQASAGQVSATACVKADNAYLLQGSAAMQAEVARAASGLSGGDCEALGDIPAWQGGAGNTGASITKDWSNEIEQRVDTDTTVNRIAFGLEGVISDAWNWDVYYQYGKTERSQIGDDYRTENRWNMATDAVFSIPGDMTSEVVCRVTRDGIAPDTKPTLAHDSLVTGCAPINPFGINTSDQAGLDYAYSALTEFNDIVLNAGAFNINGEIWEGFGAGSFQAAFGIEYRTEEFENNAGPDPLPIRSDFGLQYGDPFQGKLEALEYFAEFEMPVLADVALADSLTFNFAIRQSEYDTKGGVLNSSGSTEMTTWKASGVWDLTEWMRIRGSISQDARAPTYRELYYSQTIPAGGWFGVVTNPWLPDTGAQSQQDETEIILAGNVDLVPEEADTRTIGMVITPSDWVEGLQFSADYYEIELTGGIGLGVEKPVLDACFEDDDRCEYITFNTGNTTVTNPTGRGDIIQTVTLYGNGLPYNSSGVDVAVNYTFPVDNLISGIDGDLSLRLLSTHSLETIVRISDEERNITGQTGGSQGFLPDYQASPTWNTNFIVTYMNGPLVVTTQARFVSSDRLDVSTPKSGPGDADYDPTIVNTATFSSLASHTIWNLNGSYTFDDVGKGLTMFASINNLFDRDPPFSSGGVGGANAQFFDTMGRSFRFGIRSRF